MSGIEASGNRTAGHADPQSPHSQNCVSLTITRFQAYHRLRDRSTSNNGHMDQSPDAPARRPLRPPTAPRPPRQALRLMPVQPVSTATTADEPSPRQLHTVDEKHIVEDIQRWMNDGLEWSQVVWQLRKSGARPPEGMRTWTRTAIKRLLLLSARLKRRIMVMAAR